ncbi:hypothetical protein DE146DRAFT_361438 [Phaeosphaeria sp. MPI-PUGE-AT-0046c]|nr:hypothetical protein DE146DRAFT_361438 [Phaeosphaeria sp. MPI-PUGE-AT-0046c]
MQASSHTWARTKRIYGPIILLTFFPRGSIAKEFVDRFDVCNEKLKSVWNGTSTFMDMDKAAMQERGYLYTDWPRELPKNTDYPRDQYVTLTYSGCVALCSRGSDQAQLAEPTFALNMVTTWIFPLAIVLSLPYDSLHSHRFVGTATALLNWLGSPQTALTATIFNFHQIRKAHRRAKNSPPAEFSTWNDIYYVISCLNQFDVTSHIREKNSDFFKVLVYALFNPMLADSQNAAARYTKPLLTVIAHQLRMHRRRAFIPTMANLGTFLIALVFSIVLSFAQVGEHTKVDMLVLGLLFTWLPMLVIFTNVDRTPVSADRTGELLSRWLYNVNVVKSWDEDGRPRRPLRWWIPPSMTSQSSNRNGNVDNPFQLGPFIGQGRKLQACCLSSVLMEVGDQLQTERRRNLKDYDTSTPYNDGARKVRNGLVAHPPSSWYKIAVIGLLLVWTSITMALLLAYNTPTIGLGCWSGSFLLFGILSSLTWMLQFIRPQRPPEGVRKICTIINFLSLGWLITVVFLMVTGGTNTCWCNSLHLFPKFGDYVNLESARFYRQYCNVVKSWAGATSLGLAMPTIGILVTSLLWRECQHLWRARERDSIEALRDSNINWVFLT